MALDAHPQPAPTRPKTAGGAHTPAEFWSGLARACAGAFIFAFPLLMTMEMWWLGFYMDRLRLALLLCLHLPLLFGLAHRIGFDESIHWKENLRDTFIAYAVGCAIA